MEIRGSLHAYICEGCRGIIITMVSYPGKISEFMTCKVMQGCRGLMYREIVHHPDTPHVTHEWYKPEGEELVLLNASAIKYIADGGLVLRKLRSTTFDNPTDPALYRSAFGRPGFPLNWRDDQSGTLPAAVMAYLNESPTADQLDLCIKYAQHHIHAPCWLESLRGDTSGDPNSEEYRLADDIAEAMGEDIVKLRALSLTLKTIEDLRKYCAEANLWGVDPF